MVGRRGIIIVVGIVRPLIRRDSARAHEMAREPAPAVTFAERIVSNAISRGCRVDDAVAADVDRHVIDVITVVREEQEITRTQRAGSRGHRLAEVGHAVRGARQPNAFAPEHPLYEPRAIEAVVRACSARAEARADVFVSGREQTRSELRRTTGLDDVARGWRRHIDPLHHGWTWRLRAYGRGASTPGTPAAKACRQSEAIFPTSRCSDRHRGIAADRTTI